MGATDACTFDAICAGHFPQNTHGEQLVELILQGRS